jgi:hypothetical protein
MIRIMWSLALAGAMVAGAPPSRACRAHFSPEQRLAMGYQSGAISAVALVRIADAGYTRAPFGDAHPWRATATVRQLLQGSYTARTVRFERGWGSSACDDGRPPPKAGEVWVIYFWKRAEGDQPVWLSYPASVAFEADPRLRKSGVSRRS